MGTITTYLLILVQLGSSPEVLSSNATTAIVQTMSTVEQKGPSTQASMSWTRLVFIYYLQYKLFSGGGKKYMAIWKSHKSETVESYGDLAHESDEKIKQLQLIQESNLDRSWEQGTHKRGPVSTMISESRDLY